LVKIASTNAVIASTAYATRTKAVANVNLAIPDCSVTRLALKERTVPTVRNDAPVRTKVSATLLPGHASALLGSSETVVRMAVPRDTLERNAIVNADAEVHDAIEHLESASAMQVDTEDDATKNVLDGHTVWDARRNAIVTSIIHTNATRLMESVHADLDIKDQHAHKNAAEEHLEETARGSANARTVSHATT